MTLSRSFGYKRGRRRLQISQFLVLVGWLFWFELVGHLLLTGCYAQEQVSYEWEEWDYYTLLGLDSSSVQDYTAKDIRKAYRKQAQMYHPDKLIHHQQAAAAAASSSQNQTTTTTTSKTNGTSSSTTTKPSSKEESNARFSRIAEAYQVLSDEEQRREYDNYLRHQQIQQRQYERQQHPHADYYREEEERDDSDDSRSGASWTAAPWKKIQQMDPMRMFEEFFFGSSEEEEEEDDPYFQFHKFQNSDPRAQQHHTPPHHHQGTREHYHPPPGWFSSPDRVYETRNVWIDQGSGREVLRVIEKEVYFDAAPSEHDAGRSFRMHVCPPPIGRVYDDDDDDDCNFYYERIMAQDFIDEWDPSSRSWVYRPLQFEPTVAEEGYRRVDHTERLQMDSSVLWPGAVMKGGGRMRTTTNKRTSAYVARLASSSCELTISFQFGRSAPRVLRDGRPDDHHRVHEEDEEEHVVWTSETALPAAPFIDNDCRLKLRGPHLVLTAGNPEKLLWHSPAQDEDDDIFLMEDEPFYMSRLDDDGSLAVYRLEPVSFESQWVSGLWEGTMLSHSAGRFRDDDSPGALLRRRMLLPLWSILLGGPVWQIYSPTPQFVRGICESATGSPVGCFRLGRRLIQLFRDVKHLIQRFLRGLDRFLDDYAFASWEDDDDD